MEARWYKEGEEPDVWDDGPELKPDLSTKPVVFWTDWHEVERHQDEYPTYDAVNRPYSVFAPELVRLVPRRAQHVVEERRLVKTWRDESGQKWAETLDTETRTYTS